MVYIIKSDGEKERFSSNKIRESVLRAGGTKELADEVVRNVKRDANQDIGSEELLKIILRHLRKDRGTAARYDLKRAIMQLGPTGFPFENYFALVLKELGYEVSVGNYIQGKNIVHEVDIIAKRKHKHMIECKYHNEMGIKTRVKTPLYVYGRFIDLKSHFDSPWLATNTKCTEDVIKYAEGVGMRITAWDYPEEYSLKHLISEKKLYPITVLRSISKDAKEKLFHANIFLIKELVEMDNKLIQKRTGFSDRYVSMIDREARAVFG